MMLTLSSKESVLPYLIYTEEWTLGVAVLRAPQSYHLSVPVQDATLQMHLLFQDSNKKEEKFTMRELVTSLSWSHNSSKDQHSLSMVVSL